jgi:hypothetical protein
MSSYGQSNKKATIVTDPYKDKPFKPGDIKTLHLQIPVEKIVIGITIKYELLDDPDGMFYSFGHRYKAQINSAILTSGNKNIIPRQLIDGFSDKTIELTDREIRKKTVQTTSMFYWFTVQDFNLDGKPDFAFIGDLGYHSAPVNYYVWVNINDKLVYWYNLSGVVSATKDSTKRIISIETVQNGNIAPANYKIEKDTFLIPVHLQE